MVNLTGKHIYLRALEPQDLDFLYLLENDTAVWEISGTLKPYSKKVLRLYLDNAHRDIFEVKQLRLCISTMDDNCIGLIDLFDFDPKHKRAGIGIIIIKPEDRNKGWGAEALEILCSYAFSVLDLHQLYANILEENKASIHLFEKLGFVQIGTKKDWIRTNSGFKNELLFQKIKS
ncbi:GNAT family N-acetyltransferase [Muricauda sp. 2012CJ35-5]|uniref:GNAT family N-acetyltransferase n=1 Tax=Flagellimonas spongiicola TaxID=2942208 RepID=A0ABT0PNV4_9FLAO|nr:GNAT family N-acetyltransferase [Allomuricauda spongiicola]MCL6273064.1 GNAT family N-acetyltransferase [Allomuricauda spongiicola]